MDLDPDGRGPIAQAADGVAVRPNNLTVGRDQACVGGQVDHPAVEAGPGHEQRIASIGSGQSDGGRINVKADEWLGGNSRGRDSANDDNKPGEGHASRTSVEWAAGGVGGEGEEASAAGWEQVPSYHV